MLINIIRIIMNILKEEFNQVVTNTCEHSQGLEDKGINQHQLFCCG